MVRGNICYNNKLYFYYCWNVLVLSKSKKMKNKKFLLDCLIGTLSLIVVLTLFILILDDSYAYDATPPDRTVHQHITKEAVEVWQLIPYEIKNHTGNQVNEPLDTIGYQDDE